MQELNKYHNAVDASFKNMSNQIADYLLLLETSIRFKQNLTESMDIINMTDNLSEKIDDTINLHKEKLLHKLDNFIVNYQNDIKKLQEKKMMIANIHDRST